MIVFRWMVLPALAVCAFAGYLFFTVYRGVGYFLKKWTKKKKILLALFITVLLVAPMRLGIFWFILLAHFSAMLLLADLVFVLVRKLKKTELPGAAMIIWRGGILAALLTAVIMCYGVFNMKHVIKTEYQAVTEKPIRDEGYKLVLVADLHYGISLDHEGLAGVAGEIEKENPDVVILAGDIVDERTTQEQMEDAFATLGTISSTYGTYFTYGNHDKRLYSSAPGYTVEQLEAAAHKAGITVLEDETVSVNPELLLSGRADRSYAPERASALSLAADRDEEKVWIVADHQPAGYEELKQAGCDVVVSGHTHAGQIWPLGLFAKLFHLDEMSYGYETDDGLQMFVTSGMAGWGVCFRTQKHSEYMVISLLPASRSS